jgi:hypothetical protein
VNVLGPYLLTALMDLPARLVYLTSGLEAAGRVNLSKLHDVLLAACAKLTGTELPG